MGDLLRLRNLTVCFRTRAGIVEAVSDLDVAVAPGEVYGIVGESGCGKTATFLACLGLLPPNGFVKAGTVDFAGRNLLSLSEPELDALRGQELTYIPQDPQSALNPVITIGSQLAEPLVLHRGLSWEQARSQAVTLLERVGIPAPQQRVREYPHQLSGGMCQRVLIAMAIACRPRLLVADEPTTALDVTVQRQILDLLSDLRQETGMGIVFITHDLGVIAQMCDRVSVMYAGEIVETGLVNDVFLGSQHPYTRGLLGSLPSLNESRARLQAIEGSVPSLRERPPGCRFAPRCARADGRCREVLPSLRLTGAGATTVACHNPHTDLVGAPA
jgi:peptide/nickel transport system ATP-binding protein/oligopeptide transport system ATP-binding protein